MSKFASTKPLRTPHPGPVQTTEQQIPTFEGGDGWARTPESELFLLAVTNMAGEDTFYETAAKRDSRFAALIHEVAKTNPTWICGVPGDHRHPGFVSWLRDTAQMRSAAVVVACEYAAYAYQHSMLGVSGAPHVRQVVDAACSRADEPAEIIGYWLSQHGKPIPSAVKRGVADACRRLYTQRSALRYDSQTDAVRMADPIELCNVRPKAGDQSDLFRYLIDHRHGRYDRIAASLDKVLATRGLINTEESDRRRLFLDGRTREAGWSWERLAGWLPGGMDAEAWEGVIPSMGYMALLRNLRNFDEAKIDDRVAKTVADKLADPDEVAKSRQFPYRFFSAYKEAPSLRWAWPLEQALDLSCSNIPELSGRTLVLVDLSGSMDATVSEKSKACRWEIGALFAAALARRQATVDLVCFATHSMAMPPVGAKSVLRVIDEVRQVHMSNRLDHGTDIWSAVQAHYKGHDRVVIFSDMQTIALPGRTYGSFYGCQVPTNAEIPVIHGFNLAGYRAACMPLGKGRFEYGGFTDAAFKMLSLLEQGQRADWPF